MKKFLNIINKIWVIFFLGLMIYQLIVHGSSYTLAKNLILLCIIPIVLGPILIRKILGYTMSEILKFFYFLFIMVALICGSVLGWYHTINWFDLFAHFLSGIVFSIVALIIIRKNGLLKKEYTAFHIVFIICFGLAIASFWEFFEFFSDKLFKGDTQWVKETGVDDTMTDMLIAFLGSCIFSIYYFVKMKFNPKGFIKFLEHVL